MKRELDSTISVTGFFVLAALAAMVFSGCGRKAQAGINRGGEAERACGYEFKVEKSDLALDMQLEILAGLWVDNSGAAYKPVTVGGRSLSEKKGFQFDFLQNLYGEVSVRFSSTTPTPAQDSVTGPAVKFNALRISTPLSGFEDGTYRALDAFLDNRDSVSWTCMTYVYKVTDLNNIVIAPVPRHFVVGSKVSAPPLADHLKEVTNPGANKYLKLQ